MRCLPRSAKGTWLLAAAVWGAGCALAWETLPAQPRATIPVAGVHWPCAFSPDGTLLVTMGSTADGPNEFQFWDTGSGRRAAKIPALPAADVLALFSPDGRWLMLKVPSEQPGTDQICIWDVAHGKSAATLADIETRMPSFSPTEPLLAWPENYGGRSQVRLLELPSLRERASLPAARGVSAFSPDGLMLATAGGENESCVVIWDVADARRIMTLALPDSFLCQLTFTPDGRRLVASTFAGVGWMGPPASLVVWEMPGGNDLFHIASAVPDPICQVGCLLTGGDPFRRLNLDTGAAMYSVEHGLTREDAPGITAAGRWVAVSGLRLSLIDRCREWLSKQGLPTFGELLYRRFIYLFDAETGRMIGSLTGVLSPLLSPDGRMLAVATDDHAIQLWDVPWRPSLTRFALAAAVLALVIAGLAWRRPGRLQPEVD